MLVKPHIELHEEALLMLNQQLNSYVYQSAANPVFL